MSVQSKKLVSQFFASSCQKYCFLERVSLLIRFRQQVAQWQWQEFIA